MDLRIAYLAGVMDSDGYFCIQKGTSQTASPSYSPNIGITQCCPQATNLAMEVFGGKVRLIDRSAYYDKPTLKPMYLWTCPGALQAVTLRLLIPYLRIKRGQAEILLKLRENIDFYPRIKLPQRAFNYREKLYQRLRELRRSPFNT